MAVTQHKIVRRKVTVRELWLKDTCADCDGTGIQHVVGPWTWVLGERVSSNTTMAFCRSRVRAADGARCPACKGKGERWHYSHVLDDSA